MAKRFAVLFFLIPLAFSACKDSGAASLSARAESQAKDIDGLRGRVATLEKQVDELKRAEAKSAEQLADAAQRVRTVEATLLRVGIQPIVEFQSSSTGAAPSYPASPSTSPAPTAAASSATSPSSRSTSAVQQQPAPRASAPAKPALDEEAYRKANDFFNMPDRCKAFCNRKWPGDADQATYCYGKQLAAAQTMDRNRSFTEAEKIKRTDCYKKWGADFEMRLYCEGR